VAALPGLRGEYLEDSAIEERSKMARRWDAGYSLKFPQQNAAA
jgi:hypothetical protein